MADVHDGSTDAAGEKSKKPRRINTRAKKNEARLKEELEQFTVSMPTRCANAWQAYKEVKAKLKEEKARGAQDEYAQLSDEKKVDKLMRDATRHSAFAKSLEGQEHKQPQAQGMLSAAKGKLEEARELFARDPAKFSDVSGTALEALRAEDADAAVRVLWDAAAGAKVAGDDDALDPHALRSIIRQYKESIQTKDDVLTNLVELAEQYNKAPTPTPKLKSNLTKAIQQAKDALEKSKDLPSVAV